mgnify:CR=1 FL=1
MNDINVNAHASILNEGTLNLPGNEGKKEGLKKNYGSPSNIPKDGLNLGLVEYGSSISLSSYDSSNQ